MTIFSLQRGLQDKKWRSQNQEVSIRSLHLPDITNTSRVHISLEKAQSSKSFSHFTLSGQETKNIVQYTLKMKNRTSKSRNGVKKDVIKRITSPYYQSVLLSLRHPSDHCEYIFLIFTVGNPTRLDELCRSGVLCQQGGSFRQNAV